MLPQWLEAPPTAPASLLPRARQRPVAADVAALCRHVDALQPQAVALARLGPAPDPAIVQSLFDAGLFSLTAPLEDDGSAASLRDLVVALEHLGGLGPAYAMAAVPHLCLGVAAVARLCAPEWRSLVLRGVAERRRFIAFAGADDRGDIIGDEAGDEAGDEIGDEIGNEIGNEIGDGAGDEADDPIGDKTGNEIGASTGRDEGDPEGDPEGEDRGADTGSAASPKPPRLVRVGDGRLQLRGTAHRVANLALASHVVVLARCPGLPDAPGTTTLVLVPTDLPGVHRSPPPRNAASAWAPDAADLRLDDVAIPPARLLGLPGQGLALCHELATVARLGTTAAVVGMAAASLRSAADDRLRPLSPAQLDELETRLEVLRSALHLCAALGDVRHAEFAHASELVEHCCGGIAQDIVDTIDQAHARQGRPLPPALQQAQRAIGHFRRPKAPGEGLAQQTIAAWSARIRDEFSPPSFWPRSIAESWRITSRAFVQLRAHGGPASPASRSLTDLCARTWLLTCTRYLAQDGAARLSPARLRRCRLWAWRHYAELVRSRQLGVAPAEARSAPSTGPRVALLRHPAPRQPASEAA